jgi:hypothetical protein
MNEADRKAHMGGNGNTIRLFGWKTEGKDSSGDRKIILMLSLPATLLPAQRCPGDLNHLYRLNNKTVFMTCLSFYDSSTIAQSCLNVISPTLMHKICFRFLLGPVDFSTKQETLKCRSLNTEIIILALLKFNIKR